MSFNSERYVFFFSLLRQSLLVTIAMSRDSRWYPAEVQPSRQQLMTYNE